MVKNNNIDKSIEHCFDFIFLKTLKKGFGKKTLFTVLKDCGDETFFHKYPYGVFWKITSKCNLRCKHCFYYENQEKFASDNDFSINELLNLAKFLIEELNIVSFTITGGEPFLQEDILLLLSYLKTNNVSVQLQTNATLINKKIAKKLAQILNPKFDTVQISLEGALENTHDSIRGVGTFVKTINGIKYLTQNNINVVISYTVTSKNVDEVPELYYLSKKLGIKGIILNRFKLCSEEQAYLMPQMEDIFNRTADLIGLMKNSTDVNLNVSNLKLFDFLRYEKGKKLLDQYFLLNDIEQPTDLMCHRHEKVNICANGNIYLCADTETDELCLGNLKQKTFFEIWDNRYNNIFFKKRCIDKSVCIKCKYVALCKGGCPAMAYKKYGSICAPDSECVYGSKLLKEIEGNGNDSRKIDSKIN